MNTRQGEAGQTGSGLAVARAFRWVAATTAVLVLVQAVLAGQWVGGDLGVIVTHGWIGNLTLLGVIALTALAVVARRRGTLGGVELGLSALLVVLVIAQIGLGYGGRESATAAALHVPNGVLIFGLTAAVLALALPRRLAAAA